ncbi:MAG: B12-binding domain-containing radical SAM protein [Pseudomarimonas sp.]
MRIKFILPALTEATSPFFRPIKYSLFPPLGLATLAAYCSPSDEVTLVDEHVESLRLDDDPQLVVIQVYITNAHRAYEIADVYRARGCLVVLGGLHVTSLPDEAAMHADAVCLGPGEDIFPRMLADVRSRQLQPRYVAQTRTLLGAPPVRRDLIRRALYLVPNSLVVSRGCPHHCDFCYKDAFYAGGRGFYTQAVDAALAEIQRLPGRHLYFLDDHLLGHQRFAQALFAGMRGMGRLFQGASTVDAILRGDTIERAAEAGLRSIFIGFESLSDANLLASNKTQNLRQSYQLAIARLHALGIAINGSFVFGLDEDHEDVFARTVEWAVGQGLTTATFHVATPYPGTAYHARIEAEGRLLHSDWRRYDTRHAVFTPRHMSAATLERGYWRAYRDFYRWSNIARAAASGGTLTHRLHRFAYAAGWKKFEPLWDVLIRTRRLANMLPLLEGILDRPERRTLAAPTTSEA